MSKIRHDLVGVTIIPGPAGGHPVILRAGDKVPKGVEVGEHLLAPKGEGKPDEEPETPSPDPEGQGDGDAAGTPEGQGQPDPAPEGQGEPDVLPEPPRAGAGSSAQAWRDYADALGVEYDEGATRDEIVAAVDAAKG